MVEVFLYIVKSVKLWMSMHQPTNINLVISIYLFIYLFYQGFLSPDTNNSKDSRGREGNIFYSTLPFPPTHGHSHIYLQLYMWDDYHIFLIAPPVVTRLLLDEIYHLIELLFDWLMLIFVC